MRRNYRIHVVPGQTCAKDKCFLRWTNEGLLSRGKWSRVFSPTRHKWVKLLCDAQRKGEREGRGEEEFLIRFSISVQGTIRKRNRRKKKMEKRERKKNFSFSSSSSSTLQLKIPLQWIMRCFPRDRRSGTSIWLGISIEQVERNHLQQIFGMNQTDIGLVLRFGLSSFFVCFKHEHWTCKHADPSLPVKMHYSCARRKRFDSVHDAFVDSSMP